MKIVAIGSMTKRINENIMSPEPPITPLEWTDDLVSSIWEYYSTTPEAYFTFQFGDRILEETNRHISPGATVCDYGCGSGFLLNHLANNYKVAGIDYGEENLKNAANLIGTNPNLIGLYHTNDIEQLAGSFDVIYFVETVEHLLPDQIETTLNKLRKLLKPNGTLICTTPYDEDLSLQEVYCPETRKTFHRYQHVSSFTEATLCNFFRPYGFEDETVFTTNFSARSFKARLKIKLRNILGRKNPHLVYIGRRSAD